MNLLVWFTFTALLVAYVAYDAFTHNPEMKVMRSGWILVALYLGGSLLIGACVLGLVTLGRYRFATARDLVMQ